MRFCLFALMLGLVGCSGIEKFPMAKTTGTVTCDGKPVAKAIVYFEPISGESTALVGKQGHALTDENGKFTVSTYNDNDGAVLGKHKVRVGPSPSTPPCDCELLPNTPLKEVEIKPGVLNDFELVLAKVGTADKEREEQLNRQREMIED